MGLDSRDELRYRSWLGPERARHWSQVDSFSDRRLRRLHFVRIPRARSVVSKLAVSKRSPISKQSFISSLFNGYTSVDFILLDDSILSIAPGRRHRGTQTPFRIAKKHFAPTLRRKGGLDGSRSLSGSKMSLHATPPFSGSVIFVPVSNPCTDRHRGIIIDK